MSDHLEIGGYFTREPVSHAAQGEAPHLGPNPARLNSGRNGLRAVLARRRCRRLHLPDYICDTVIDAVRACGVEPVFHAIDDQLNVIDALQTDPDEQRLLVDWFGLGSGPDPGEGPGLILDNCQAFFAAPRPDAVTFYSPRKFFGLADGGYVVGAALGDWPPDIQADLSQHMEIRAAEGARAGYEAYRAHEQALARRPVRAMSPGTRAMLSGIDYAAVARIRQANYRLLNAALGADNKLDRAVNVDPSAVPMVYPFLGPAGLKDALNRRGIFAAGYWPDCLARAECGPGARRLAAHLTALPIDQRYGLREMQTIIAAVQEHLSAARVQVVVS